MDESAVLLMIQSVTCIGVLESGKEQQGMLGIFHTWWYSPGEQMPSASRMLCLQMGFRVAASSMGPITLSKVWLV